MDKSNFSVYSTKKRYLEVVFLDPSKLKKNYNLMAVGSRTASLASAQIVLNTPVWAPTSVKYSSLSVILPSPK
jgi:hypothetical protein